MSSRWTAAPRGCGFGDDSVTLRRVNPLLLAAGCFLLIDGVATVERHRQRAEFFKLATRAARERGKPLLIVGSPSGWSTTTPSSMQRHGCGDGARGDVVIDIAPVVRECPNGVRADVRDLSRWRDGYFGAVYMSCVAEHVDDLRAGWREIKRVAADPKGERIFVVFPQAWSPFSVWCGAHRWVIEDIRDGKIRARPIPGRGAIS